MSTSRKPVTILSLVLIGLLLLVMALPGLAAPTITDTLIASGDTFIINNDNTNHNGELLEIDLSLGSPSRFILLQFDLSGIGYTIDKARLNFDAGCFDTIDPMTIALYAADETTGGGWDETTATWANAGTSQGALLVANLDEGDTSAGVGTYHFTDDVGGTFATYLDGQRGGIASLWMEATSTTMPGGIASGWIQDKESSFGCNLPLAPTLQLADNQDPLAINMLSMQAQTPQPDLLGVVALAGTGLLLTGLWLYRRRTVEVN